MADLLFQIAVGFNQTTYTNIEDLWGDPPYVMPDQTVSEMLPVKRRTLSGRVQRNGKRTLKWVIDHMTPANLSLYNTTIFPGGIASQEVTIVTLSEYGVYIPCNAIADRPVPGEDFQYWHGGDIRALTQTFFDVTPLAAAEGNGLLLENGLGIQLETGDFLLQE